MAGTHDRRPQAPQEASPAPPHAGEATDRSPSVTAVQAAPPDQHAAPTTSPPPGPPAKPAEPAPPAHHLRNWLLLGGILVALGVAAYFLYPMLETMLTTVSTDDAYVNGHVTFVAPRVAGQVKKVLVDDNMRVKKGDVLVQLDPEPYDVQVGIKEAVVLAAERDLAAANAQVRGIVARARSNRFKLEHAMEDVNNQIANLRANVAAYNSRKATLTLAQANLTRGEELIKSAGISREELDQRRQAVAVAEAAVEQALETVYAIRVGLGLPERPAWRKVQIGQALASQAFVPPGVGVPVWPQALVVLRFITPVGLPLEPPPNDRDLVDVPPDLDQTFSTVREALAGLTQSAAEFGYFPASWDATPREAIAAFYRQDPKGNVDRIYAKLIPKAPAIEQAKAKLVQANRDLDQARLNRRYCDVVSETDGVVTRRNVNPGNNVQVGQSLMAVRALRPPDLWIDANFKETQLADLRIGQRVRIEVDMYGSRHEFKGYISGFTMGTGQTLALLPPQNATGNFVKIVQRLPVRIELLDYDPDKAPLFVGLSVEPYVEFKEPLVEQDMPGKGQKLQPLAALPKAPVQPRP